MTRITRNIPADCCCDSWKKGIRTINGQYPDDNREFGIVEGAGILITPVTAGIKITNITDPGALQAGQNIKFTTVGDHLEIATTDDIAVTGDLSVAGDSTLNGDLNVNGDIYQQGASYESHMEQVYTTDDYIIMRDGAVAALPNGQYAGFQVKKYDGTNDGRLVIDNTGTARVGDVGDEQPLLTRAESGSLTNGQLLKWDGNNSRAVTQQIDTYPTSGSGAPVSSGGVYERLQETFGKRVIIGANYPAFADFFNAIASTIEGKPYILKYFDNSSGNFVCLNGVGDTISYMGVGGTCYVSSVYYQANRIQFNSNGAYLYRLNSSFSESVYTLDYTKFKIYY